MTTTQYGIRVTSNRFQLADFDDEDPLEILRMREKELEARKKTKLAEKENKSKIETSAVKPVKQTAPNKNVKQNNNTENQKGKEEAAPVKNVSQGERFERKFTGDNRNEKVNIASRNSMEAPTGESAKEDKADRFDRRDNRQDWNSGEKDFEGRRGGRGRSYVRGGRGRAGPRQNETRRKEFDRHSGSDKTGVKSVDKRDGHGARNWGNAKDDNFDDPNVSVAAEDDMWTASSPEKKEQDSAEESIAKNTETEVTPVIEESLEPKELTLDEWKAMKGPRQAPTYNIRKAGEGEDLSQWKKMYALRKKKEGEEDDDEEEYEYDSSEYPQRVGRQKHVLDIDIHFKDTRGAVRGRGGRGGRGGNRSYQNADRSASHNSVPKIAPKVDDEHDFPSLS